MQRNAERGRDLREKSGKRRPKSPLHQAALATERALWTVKLAHRAESFWYPYSTLRNLKAIDQLLTASGFNLLELCRGVHAKLADIGTADGDLAFFLEQNGFSVDAIDFEPTNFNQMGGNENLETGIEFRRHNSLGQFGLPIFPAE
jgi:hypothetical protein